MTDEAPAMRTTMMYLTHHSSGHLRSSFSINDGSSTRDVEESRGGSLLGEGWSDSMRGLSADEGEEYGCEANHQLDWIWLCCEGVVNRKVLSGDVRVEGRSVTYLDTKDRRGAIETLCNRDRIHISFFSRLSLPSYRISCHFFSPTPNNNHGNKMLHQRPTRLRPQG